MMKTKTLLAYHGDPKIKAKYLGRVRAHRKADDIISGQYWEPTGPDDRHQGCAVGCTLHSNSHRAYETELGIPEVLARLEDRLFEGLWKGDPVVARMWPERFLAAIKPGAGLFMVLPRFAHWLLIDPDCGVIRHAKREKTIAAIKNVAALYQRWIDGDKPEASEWRNAADAADAAAAYAAAAADAADAAAAYAAAAYAAADAADAYAAAYADAAAYAAAYAYAYAYADAAAGKRHYAVMADKLIELLEGAK